MKALLAILVWFGFGALGAAGTNARYQFDPNWWENGCYTQERRHLTDELQFFVWAPIGPPIFIASAIDTGLFNSGFSFKFGYATTMRVGA